MRRLRYFAIADHHLRRSAHDRRNEPSNVSAEVLIVSVGVDDDVRAESKREVDTGDERSREPAMRFQLQNVTGAGFARGVDSVVAAAVIDHKRLDR